MFVSKIPAIRFGEVFNKPPANTPYQEFTGSDGTTLYTTGPDRTALGTALGNFLTAATPAFNYSGPTRAYTDAKSALEGVKAQLEANVQD